MLRKPQAAILSFNTHHSTLQLFHETSLASLAVVCGVRAGGVLAGMAWLTQQALQADERRRVAEAEAELEQRVSLALWRMDTELAPIIAEEVIRPAAEFRPGDKAVEPPPYVLLQFEARDKDLVVAADIGDAQSLRIPRADEV